ncbi:conserved hypothetical protein [Ferrimonas balearica DSM 9799]|uniref:Glycine zipper family protein n=1 Tax=Ferrimonas balearica (strain DSM 9799 / CCM 4581 / KCTC 23876 / PAT) TaxID=550540 RepID=E1SLJ6_FERBD|nr:glycine zipper family protein [Ferrimonas balearica]ADN77547.1 conserved hypothetical protein [Ferrimonas balearica DSM 9799]MBY5981620.1 glycine zipper family protein [Ferrimonas balearica]MBY6019008.1 glycine zipper family protein [Halomonas denitrificans]
MRTQLAAAFALLMTGCAYNQAPVVDMTNVDPSDYQNDLAYCETYAEQVDKGEAAKVGAVNGSLSLGGAGAIAGAVDNGWSGALVGMLVGASLGAAGGSADGALEATRVQGQVLRRCLSEMGYHVYDLET